MAFADLATARQLCGNTMKEAFQYRDIVEGWCNSGDFREAAPLTSPVPPSSCSALCMLSDF